MNILMVTNTYFPHVGGVAASVRRFETCYRHWGHKVMVIAPEYDGMPEDEPDVLRVPSIRHFNGSDFSLVLTIPDLVDEEVEHFQPDIIHSHHPYLLGDTALRIAASREIPIVFTHHTMYEHYTHYVPAVDSRAMRRFIINLSTGYANLCDHVIAPSESIRSVLQKRGVKTPITVVPSGVNVKRFSDGDAGKSRRLVGIPSGALVVGTIGRLAQEKNLHFLAGALVKFLLTRPEAHCLIVGCGPEESAIRNIFGAANLSDRLHIAGILAGHELVDAYHALDIFAFASQTETQGMVLAEAMAAGRPVVALDGPGVREVVQDRRNGRLINRAKEADFCQALEWMAVRNDKQRRTMAERIHATAKRFDETRCARRELSLYQKVLGNAPRAAGSNEASWPPVLRALEKEWKLWGIRLSAAVEAALGHSPAS